MDDTWFGRDLPVLDAIVRMYDEGDTLIKANEIVSATGFDEQVVQQALRALRTGDYFEKVTGSWGNGVMAVSTPTAAARRAVGAWPTAEIVVQRLVEALESASNDDTRPDEERGKLRQAAAWLGSFGYQVAIGALGGAGGNIISG